MLRAKKWANFEVTVEIACADLFFGDQHRLWLIEEGRALGKL